MAMTSDDTRGFCALVGWWKGLVTIVTTRKAPIPKMEGSTMVAGVEGGCTNINKTMGPVGDALMDVVLGVVIYFSVVRHLQHAHDCVPCAIPLW